jgi:hypothetical protein
MIKNIRLLTASLLFVLLASVSAHATISTTSLTTDLNNLVLEGNTLIATMTSTTLLPITATSQIADLTTQVAVYNDNVQLLYEQLLAATGTTISLSNELLIALQALSATQTTLAEASLTLSTALLPLALATMENSFYSMLQMADEIGSMANRILEMADKILLMADNIGLMADRILATQVIQNTNIALTYEVILQTQQNMLTLFSMFQ